MTESTTIGERQAIARLRAAADHYRHNQDAYEIVLPRSGFAGKDDHAPALTVGDLRAILATPTTNAPVAETAPDKLHEMLLAVEDFINEPQRNRDIEPMEVRDYRHELYRKWSPLCQAILALRQTLPIHGEMREALEGIIPTKLCGESWDLPDTETVSIVVTFGALRRARNALTSNTGSSS